ncbi:prenyltransferase/squalene oxidase repeat-containing protein [Actinacidiphila sp. ITFR-21]|uniref:prenyltransferase/squalene oxidase repeat-containing protein n=1 Tax=Actinacidiphila sp. ITFR-21 TaxID=3075199 RepID=UPI00288919AE|nr:prenyltransferase/squalene oxidase repeat-containing protein [Streptomyces sp. ITFR-21]WNI18834.1 prenyltransferase/squalene oxidase repeat-containing protein [Streptomyces sp. ITFR-21]
MLRPAPRRRHRQPRAAALLTAAALVLAGLAAGLFPVAAPAHADPIGACTPTTGAIVAVDFGHWGGPVLRGCDAHPTTGMNLLHNAGFTTTGTVHDGPGFVCRIGDDGFDGGTPYPTTADEACVPTPSADAYWSFWTAPAGQDTWSHSPLGAQGDQPRDGEVEAWTYGSTDAGGTTGGPAFTPGSVRAQGTPTTPPTTPATTGPTTPPTPPGGGPADVPAAAAPTTPADSGPPEPAATTPDLAKGVAYLINRGNLVGGRYYSAAGQHTGFADFGLTVDGLFALAATGGADTTLAAVTDFLQHGKDGTGRTADDWTLIGTSSAQGGSLAKEALAAEVTGGDPRSFGGHDLIRALDGTVCAAADTAKGCAAKGNYAYAGSVFSQSLGVIAQLRAADSAGAAGPLAYLESLQDPDGAWPSLIPSGKDQDVDSTAMAMMALDLVPGDAAARAVAKGAAWIAGRQLADGGFHGAAGDSVTSAALAVQGLGLDAVRYRDRIAAARRFLAEQQNPDGGFRVASDSDQTLSDVRASAQAVGGSTGTSFGTLLRDLADQKAAAAGSAYLVGRLAGGDHLSNAYGPDYGLTADLALALAATGRQDTALTKVTGYLAGHTADYADPAGTSDYPGPYSGATAKLALLAEVMGQDPHRFGGFDLLATLTGHVCATATDDGACTAPGDFSQAYSTVSQALGVLALARAGQTPPPAAVDRLLHLQCADGGFSSTLAAAGADCASDVDTTGYALQAITLVPGHADAVAAARAYLVGAQQKNGGYRGAAGVSSNSTALAAQALLATDRIRPAAARGGQEFLRSAQNRDGGFRITDTAGASDTRSTTQAVPALAGTPLTTLTHALAPIAPTGSGGTGPSSGGSPGTPPGGSDSGGGSLAATGSDALTAAGGAVLLLAAGGVLTAARRRTGQGTGRHQ